MTEIKGCPITPDISIQPEQEQIIGASLIKREKGFLSDGSPILLTTITTLKEAPTDLIIDERFGEKGIEFEPGEWLINQRATKESWGETAGRTPEDHLVKNPLETVGICPTNWGWQKSAFLIRDGELFLIKNDEGKITGQFNLIALTEKGWTDMSLNLENGQLKSDDKNKLKMIRLGMSLPLILKDEKVVPLGEIIGDPRFLADLRNVFNFGAGKNLPPEFWDLLRGVMPTTKAAARRLAEGRKIALSQKDTLNEEKLEKFKRIISENNLDKYLYIDRKNGITRFAVIKNLPLNRNPVIGVGFDKDGRLLVVTVDGRQKESVGVTIEELAKIMKAKGAITAGLGCAGGDVAVVAKEKESYRILNSPSNKDPETGERMTRPLPSLLIIEPKTV